MHQRAVARRSAAHLRCSNPAAVRIIIILRGVGQNGGLAERAPNFLVLGVLGRFPVKLASWPADDVVDPSSDALAGADYCVISDMWRTGVLCPRYIVFCRAAAFLVVPSCMPSGGW